MAVIKAAALKKRKRRRNIRKIGNLSKRKNRMKSIFARRRLKKLLKNMERNELKIENKKPKK